MTKHASYRITWAFCLILALVCGLTACAKKTPEDVLADAVQALQRNDMVGAMVKCRKIIEENPDAPAAQQARSLQASIFAQNNNLEGAYALWDEIIERDGVETEIGKMALLGRLEALVKEDKAPEVIAQIEAAEAALQSDPEFAWQLKLKRLGPAYVRNEEQDKAIALLKSLLADAQNEEQTRMATDSLVSVYATDEAYKDEAIALLQSAIADAEGEEQTMMATEDLIRLYATYKNYNEAIQVYQDYLAANPGSKFEGSLYFGIGHYHNQIAAETEDADLKAAEVAKATEALMKSAELLKAQIDEELVGDTRIRLTRQLSSIYLEMEDEATAIQTLETAIETFAEEPNRVLLMAGIAELHLISERYDEAKTWLGTIQETFPNTQPGQQAAMFLQNIDRMLQQKQAAEAAQALDAMTTESVEAAPAVIESVVAPE